MKRTQWLATAAITTAALFTPPDTLLAQTPDTSQSVKSQTWRSILDHNSPRLVVVITFDQFRADLLTRFSDQFLPAFGANATVGGFRYLMENGATMADAMYNHLPLHTGPGHATIMTGAAPRYTGIIANSWNTTSGLSMNCVEDPNEKTIGTPNPATRLGSSSPRNLLAQTVGDELRLSNNRQSKVYGISIKDRGAILPTGHTANGAVWFDANYGRWVTSTYYTTGTLPLFAQHFNDEKVADRWAGKEWDYLLPKEAYNISMPEGMPGVGDARGLPSTFPKQLSQPGKQPGKEYYNHLIFTPYGNAMTFETAKMAVQYEELGQDLYPDILAVSLSTLDLVGHSWGASSRETQDTILRADRQMADFLNYLETAIPGGLDNILIVLTGDHGGTTLPEYNNELKLSSGRVQYSEIIDTAEAALAKTFPDKQTTGLVQFSDPHISFRTTLLNKRGIDIKKATNAIAEAIRQIPGIRDAYTRQQIETGQLPKTRQAQMITNGFNPKRCGEIMVISDQQHYNSRGNTGSTHGTPWNYDTHVPLIFCGPHIQPGIYTDRADIRDIAPTLSFLLGITAPDSSEGNILTNIIK